MSSTPHDALFKATFSNVEHAASELALVLPRALAARIDFPSLALCPGSAVDEALRERHTDLLFSASLAGRPALIYVLFEHQSTVDPLMPFRLLRYVVRIWEGWLRDHPKAGKLPAIVPVVLHHSESGWTAPIAFEELLDLDADGLAAFGDHLPRFRFVLDDLSAATDEALHARTMTALARLALWCLRHARSPDDLVAGLSQWADLVHEARQAPNGAAAIALIWRYIFTVNDRFQPEELVARLTAAVGESEKEEIVTVADQLIEQGRRKGLQQGHREGQREMLLRQLRVRFGALPESAVAQIDAADGAQLETFAERVLTAASLAEALAER
jgi:predicted transposase/invertase (TIGR01784 family)